MPIGINNVSGNNQNINQSQAAIEKTFNKISTGLKINSAKDDAAGLAIAVNIATELQGLSQAERNANDAISLTQVADGALSEAQNLLSRARELSLQAANGTNTATDRQAIQSEVNQIQQQLQDISQTTFNDIEVFSDQDIQFQISENAGGTVNVNLNNPFSTTQLDVTSEAGAQSAVASIDQALDDITAQRAELGAVQNRFESAVNNINNRELNQATSLSRIQDADIASETAELTKNQILLQAGIAAQAQANVSKEATVKLLT